MSKNYFRNVFTEETWQQFIEHGKKGEYVTGFPESYTTSTKTVKIGDVFICYLAKVGRVCGMLEVTSEVFTDQSKIWDKASYPVRFKVRPLIIFNETELAIPFLPLWPKTEYYKSMVSKGKNTKYWGTYWQRSFGQIPSIDGELFCDAIAKQNKSPNTEAVPTKRKYRKRNSSSSIETSSDPVRERLIKLKAYLEDGLIDKEQYADTSNKILNDHFLVGN